MRKEVILAILFGVSFGLVIAFGVWRLNGAFTSSPDVNGEEPTPTPSTQTSSSGLIVSKPNELSVQASENIQIIGATQANSWIVASGEDTDFVVKTKSDGAFEVPAQLAAGLNQILLISKDDSGSTLEKTLSLVHSTQFQKATASEDAEATSSADEIREKVQDKVDQIQNAPVAYTGTITDISELSLNLKNSSDEIKQVSVTKETVYVNDISKKEIKFNDLAIGDFLLAMGYKNGNQVLEAKRIVVTNKPVTPARKIHFGKVSELKNKVIKLAKSGENIELTFPKTWKGPNIKDIKEEADVVVVANSESKNEIRTIQILD